MFKRLAEEICQLTCVLRESLKQRQTEFEWRKTHLDLVTQRDFDRAMADIFKAIAKIGSGGNDRGDLKGLTAELKAHAGPLAKAVADNQPISGQS